MVADRAAFWAVLAEYQGRDMQVEGTGDGPFPVRLTEYDLTTAVDILLRDNLITVQDVEDIQALLRKGPLKMDLEGALVFKEKITSEQLSQANDKANTHNKALAKDSPQS